MALDIVSYLCHQSMSSLDEAGAGGSASKAMWGTSTSRRVLLPLLVSFAAAASASTSSPAIAAGQCKGKICELDDYTGADPNILVRRGMERFKLGRVEESVADFDRVMELDPRYGDVLWQRVNQAHPISLARCGLACFDMLPPSDLFQGLSLYYLDKYDEAAAQFQRDVRLNPRDSEEAIWKLAALARKPGSDFQALQKEILPILPDSRPYMKAAYLVFAGQKPPEELERFVQAAGEKKEVGSPLAPHALHPQPNQKHGVCTPHM